MVGDVDGAESVASIGIVLTGRYLRPPLGVPLPKPPAAAHVHHTPLASYPALVAKGVTTAATVRPPITSDVRVEVGTPGMQQLQHRESGFTLEQEEANAEAGRTARLAAEAATIASLAAAKAATIAAAGAGAPQAKAVPARSQQRAMPYPPAPASKWHTATGRAGAAGFDPMSAWPA